MKIEPLSSHNGNNHYLVTCDNGREHTVIADHVENNFQYYYRNKGYYIKYDIEFKGYYDFAEWVCRNK
jgi:hypothetical protein